MYKNVLIEYEISLWAPLYMLLPHTQPSNPSKRQN
jgi:hypothetical protein